MTGCSWHSVTAFNQKDENLCSQEIHIIMGKNQK